MAVPFLHVTVRWDSYMSMDYYSRVETGDEIPDAPHCAAA